MARTTDIYCKECGSKAVVTRTERIHSTYSKLYCSCRNHQCGHKFVMNLEFSHTTQSSQFTKDGLIKFLIGKLSETDKTDLIHLLNEKSR